MAKYIMALDQGTTSSRAVIYDHEGRPVSAASKEFRQYYPKEAWVEHDPMELWSTQISVAQEALLKVNGTYKDLAGIGITNQRETSIIWDKITGEAIYPAIVWQCRRTADKCKELKAKGLEDIIKRKTGLLLDPYFSATKINWILDKVDGARERAERGDLLFGTVDTWLVWKMTAGKYHVTDYTNASRTLLFNINSLEWDRELLEIFNIPRSLLPKAIPSSAIISETAKEIFGGPVLIAGIAGDQQAALFGQACFEAGDLKSTYGTGGFLLMNTGKEAVFSKSGLLTTLSCDTEGNYGYALEGSIFVAGAAVQWLRDEMRLVDSAEDTEYLASKVPNTGGVYLVPAFAGLGAPHWEPYARGMVTGITRATNKNHIIRASLESLAYQNYDLLKLMEQESGKKVPLFRVDGGACKNDFLMEFQADILAIPVERPVITETTALGAAYLAGISTGFWKNKEEIRQRREVDKSFQPSKCREDVDGLLRGWQAAINSAIFWAQAVKNQD